MSLDDWIIALHLLSAFALVGAVTVFSIILVVLRRVDTPGRVLALAPAALIANVTVLVGVLGTFGFGVWLAISLDEYGVWDGWVLAAIVLWAVGSELGRRTGVIMAGSFERAEQLVGQGHEGPDAALADGLRSRHAHVFHWVSTAAMALIILDMIWKPGA
ncbi:MAG: hypothetical protein OEV72_09415 [Thermoleophilia bacterium]|nr:hypothetical protein [Thermoleophilia bacterium]